MALEVLPEAGIEIAHPGDVLLDPCPQIESGELENLWIRFLAAVDFPEARPLDRLEIVVIFVFRGSHQEQTGVVLPLDVPVDAGNEQEPVGIALFIGPEAALAVDDVAVLSNAEMESNSSLISPEVTSCQT